MQRRAAAIYAAFFLVIAVGAYAAIGVAQEPAIAVDDPEFTLSAGDTFEVDGTTYTVGEIEAGGGEGDDGHGGGPTGPSTELLWVDDQAETSETWADGDTVTIDETDFEVTIDAESEPPVLQLSEVQELPDDVETVEIDGTTYVIEDPESEPVEEEEYLRERFGEPEQRTLAEGDTFDYQNTTATVESIDEGAATIAWVGEQENALPVADGTVTTLGETEFVAHFADDETLVLTSDVEAYERQAQAVETFHERVDGFRGIAILSGLSALLVLGLAYMPSRY